MTRIAVAGFQHETNSFSPIPTTWDDFTRGGINSPGILKGDDLLLFQSREMNNATSGFMRKAAELGYTFAPLLWAEAEPSNNMSEETFDCLVQLYEDAFRKSAPYDGVFLDLHGAMIFGEGRDGETELLKRLRLIVGSIPIVAALDLHGNIDPECFELATALVGCRTYPHVDLYETGERCALVMDHLLNGRPLYRAFKQLPFLIPTSSQVTDLEPMKHVFDQLESICRDEQMVTASVMLGFPPGDIACAGPSVFSYAETLEQADKTVEVLSQALIERECECISRLVEMDEALDRAMALAQKAGLPVILADAQDNPGGGSGSDSVVILEALLQRNVKNAAMGLLYDPQSAAAAHAAGEGAEIALSLGGKLLPGHVPLTGQFRVIKLLEGKFEGSGPMGKGLMIDFGKMALLQIDGVYISVASSRIQAADQAVFTIFGLDPAQMDILVLKSFIHFRAAFEAIAEEIIMVKAPGAEFDDPAGVPYRFLRSGMRLGGCGPVLETGLHGGK